MQGIEMLLYCIVLYTRSNINPQAIRSTSAFLYSTCKEKGIEGEMQSY
jgi:hypothetical protein